MAASIVFWQGKWPYGLGRVVVINNQVFVEKEVKDSLGVTAWVEAHKELERCNILMAAVASVANKTVPRTSWERLDEDPNAPATAASPVAEVLLDNEHDDFSSLLDEI